MTNHSDLTKFTCYAVLARRTPLPTAAIDGTGALLQVLR